MRVASSGASMNSRLRSWLNGDGLYVCSMTLPQSVSECPGLGDCSTALIIVSSLSHPGYLNLLSGKSSSAPLEYDRLTAAAANVSASEQVSVASSGASMNAGSGAGSTVIV
jgi:hypothetical protein